MMSNGNPDKTIADTIQEIAVRGVQSSSEADKQVERISIDDLIKAENHQAGSGAANKPHRGLRYTKCRGPGTG